MAQPIRAPKCWVHQSCDADLAGLIRSTSSNIVSQWTSSLPLSELKHPLIQVGVGKHFLAIAKITP
jgi:hypothetical protein